MFPDRLFLNDIVVLFNKYFLKKIKKLQDSHKWEYVLDEPFNASINRKLINTTNLFCYALAASYYAVVGGAAVKR